MKIIVRNIWMAAIMIVMSATVRAQVVGGVSKDNEEKGEVTATALLDSVAPSSCIRVLVEEGVGGENLSRLVSNSLSDYGRVVLVWAGNVKIDGEGISGIWKNDKKLHPRLNAARAAGFDYVFGVRCTSATQTHTTTTTRTKSQTFTNHNYNASQSYEMRIYSTDDHSLVQKLYRWVNVVRTISGDYRPRVTKEVVDGFPRNFRKIINQAFPVTGKVTGTRPVTGKKKSLYATIDLGREEGVTNKDELRIYIDKAKKGDVEKKHIGNLTVSTASEHSAECLVTRGEKKVEKAFKSGLAITVSDSPDINDDDKEDGLDKNVKDIDD